MAEIRNQLKKIWIRSMETVGNTASSIASNTKFKVDEMNLQNQRREIIANIGSLAYVLWQKGEAFPEEIRKQLQEIQTIDERLNDMRAERYAGKVEAAGNDAPAENAAAADGRDENAADAAAPAEGTDATEAPAPAEETKKIEKEKPGIPTVLTETYFAHEREAEWLQNSQPARNGRGELSLTEEDEPEVRRKVLGEVKDTASVTESIDALFNRERNVEIMADKVKDSLQKMGAIREQAQGERNSQDAPAE